MKLGKITKDALEYPFLDVRKVLLVGFLMVLTDLSGFSRGFGIENPILLLIFGILGALVGIYVLGYLYKVVETSDTRSLPRFSEHIKMFEDGVKTLSVVLVYLVPALIVLAVVTSQNYNELFQTTYGSVSSEPLSMIGILLGTLIWPGIFNLVGLLYNGSIVSGIYIQAAIIYIIVVFPVIFKAIRNLACTGELVSAFKIRDILSSMYEIGFLSIALWYLTTVILLLLILLIGMMATNIFSVLIHPELGAVILSVTFVPYLYIFLVRSVSLAFQGKIDSSYGAYIF